LLLWCIGSVKLTLRSSLLVGLLPATFDSGHDHLDGL
jgi:hypothetical protein